MYALNLKILNDFCKILFNVIIFNRSHILRSKYKYNTPKRANITNIDKMNQSMQRKKPTTTQEKKSEEKPSCVPFIEALSHSEQ